MKNPRCFPFLAVLAAMLIGWSGYAHAGRVTVENHSDHEIYFAFVFYDYKKKDFYIRSWFKVPVGERKSWNFNIAPDRKFYWFGRTKNNKRIWPGSDGDQGQSVINKSMNMKASAVKTYADAKVVKFRTRETDADGNITIGIK